MSESPYSALRYRVAEGIAHIVLDRPPLNLIDEVFSKRLHTQYTKNVVRNRRTIKQKIPFPNYVAFIHC